ncbi:MAG: glycoside hydrolase family 108 protein [Candidatus Afipia apatlaquensis]|uniref:Glycoside hydrolase family 108 protein n=1 Tax=Candidatus Afipia apatlaquensis TaxID=2712852 RepID=A0A7C9RI40_9BRAD|nr:glycoside hydrolase family 108 protein [Candidatus Afipia apatlaquensis]
MAAESYNAALTRLLKDEGGYTDHPSDPGGPTNFGITLADARRYWKGNATADDVRTMPQSAARKIYRERYWNAMRCDELPAGVDYAVFDYGVNSGIGRAGKVLRRVLEMPDSTSAVTSDVIAATSKRNAGDLVAAICAERLAFLQGLKIFPVFGRGWTARVNGVRVAALAMAQGRTPAAATSAETSAGKAVVPVKNPAGPASAGAVIAAGAAAAVTTSRFEVAALVVAAALGASVAVFLIWRWRHRAAQEAAVKAFTERTSNGLG